jgi:hypothetical protein
MGLEKYDYRPLLAPGRHFLSPTEIEALCVLPFRDADRLVRQKLFSGFEEFARRILGANVRCDLFIDGSFLTAKPQPDDVDVMVSVELDVLNSLTEHQLVLLEALNGNFVRGVDSLALTTYPRGHPNRGTLIDLGNPGEIYGLEHGQVWLKGYVVLRLLETDVGNRICR